MKIQKNFSGAFTLIELLAVIAIIGVLAGFIIGGIRSAKQRQAITAATAELKLIEDALESYKLKYGAYPPANQLSSSAAPPPLSMRSPLFYELSGVTNYSPTLYLTLDGAFKLSMGPGLGSAYLSNFGLERAVNQFHGNGEDAKAAENFLPGLKSTMIGTYGNVAGPLASVSNPQLLVTSVRGPDPAWQPLGSLFPDLNPFQYAYPGTNNPSGYDLWVELHISGKTNIIGNWTAK